MNFRSLIDFGDSLKLQPFFLVHGSSIENDGLLGWEHSVHEECSFLLFCLDERLHHFFIALLGLEWGQCFSNWVFRNDEI